MGILAHTDDGWLSVMVLVKREKNGNGYSSSILKGLYDLTFPNELPFYNTQTRAHWGT